MCYKLSQNLGRPGFHSVYSEECKACYFIKAASGGNFWSEKAYFVGFGNGLSLFPGHRLSDGGSCVGRSWEGNVSIVG